MKNLKRIVAMFAMLAVLLSSFAFAEGEVAVEAVESVAATVAAAELPAEEAAAEEVNAELLAEETTVEPKANECVEHRVSCFMPDMCYICKQPVEGVPAQHASDLYTNAPKQLPDEPNLHGYFCGICLDYVDTEEHFASCTLGANTCSVCGAAVSADSVNHSGLAKEFTAIAGTGNHGLYCTGCKSYLKVGVHSVDCLNADLTHCETCGAEVGKDAVVHNFVNGLCTKCKAGKGIDKVNVAGSVKLSVGDSHTLKVTTEPAEIDASIEYMLTGNCITLNMLTGEIKAVAAGTATITVIATGPDGNIVTAEVSVVVDEVPTGISLTKSSMELYVGKEAQLTAELKGASSAKLNWESSNPAVAVVDTNGLVIATGKGEATITVSTVNGLKASCKVSVIPEPAWIEVVDTDLRMYYKQTLDLKARLVDEDGEECEGELSFVSSVPSIVEVSDSGKITVKKSSKGTIAVITISSGKLTGDVYVTVCDVPSKVKLAESKATLNRGESYQLEPIIDDDEATVYTYTSSKSSVASVDANGLITAEGEGSATITVKTHNNKKTTFKVTVKDPYAPESVELDLSGTYYLGVGEELQLGATIYPETAEGTLSWSSGSTKVATVDEDGVVTGIKTGTAKITVKTHNGKKDTVSIKVVKADVVAAVELEETGTLTLGIGETLSLNANVLPASAETTLSWKSSSTKYATVDEDGVVEGVKAGTTTITVSSKNGKKDTVKVKVIDPTIADSVVLSESGTLTVNIGEPIQLNAEVLPATAETELTWSSSKAKYATVDDDGIVTPLSKGTVTITVKTDNGKKDTVKIKVVDEHKPTSIKLPSVANLVVGKTDIVTPDIEPANAKTYLTWTSSNKKVLTVEDGMITAIGAGTATITVETHNGKEASVKVTVVEAPKPSYIEASVSGNGTIGIGEKAQISAVVTPADAVYTLSYASSNTAIATVDAKGVVTGVAAGECAITVSTNNGLSARVSITVDANKDPNANVELRTAINSSVDELKGMVSGLQGSGSSYSDASGALKVTFAGGQAKYIELIGSGRFSLYGVKIGMSVSNAVNALVANGVTVTDANENYIWTEIPGCALEITVSASGTIDYIGVFAI